MYHLNKDHCISS